MSLVTSSDWIARWVRNDEFGTHLPAVDDGVLTKRGTERDGLFAADAVDEPSGFAPCPIRFFVVANTVLDSKATQNEQIPQNLMTRFVDAPREQHGAGVVCRDDGKLGAQEVRQR